MEAQRWRLAMFASDGWFWDDPARPETAGVLRAAARAARLIDGLAGRRASSAGWSPTSRLFTSPGHGIDGATIYRRALDDVGQPGVAERPDAGASGMPTGYGGAARIRRIDAAVDAVAIGQDARRPRAPRHRDDDDETGHRGPTLLGIVG